MLLPFLLLLFVVRLQGEETEEDDGGDPTYALLVGRFWLKDECNKFKPSGGLGGEEEEIDMYNATEWFLPKRCMLEGDEYFGDNYELYDPDKDSNITTFHTARCLSSGTILYKRGCSKLDCKDCKESIIIKKCEQFGEFYISINSCSDGPGFYIMITGIIIMASSLLFCFCCLCPAVCLIGCLTACNGFVLYIA